MSKNIKILLPTDFSEAAQNALRYALQFGDKLEAEIELVHAVYPEYAPADIPVASMQATREKVDVAHEAMKAFVDTSLAQLQTHYQLKNVPVLKQDVEIGNPVPVITAVANRKESDLIVLGTKNRHTTLEKIFGTVASGVVQQASCHVLVIPESYSFEGLTNIVYASNLQESDPYHIWQALRLLEPFSAIIQCVHVQPESGNDRAHLDLDELKNYFANRAPAIKITFQNIEGELPDALNDFAGEHGADLLIMSTPHRSFINKLFHNSLTKKMARKSHLPLLVLKEQR